MNSVHPSEAQQMADTYRQKPDGDIDPAGEVGWFMQRERERRGLSYEQAGADINIHPHHLEAIEFGDLTRLPSRSDALSMIGNYALYLGFDPQPIVMHYAQFLPQPVPAPAARARRKVKPRPLGSAKVINFPLAERLRSMTSGAGGVVSSVLAVTVLFAGAAWILFPQGEPVDSRIAQAESPAAISAKAPDGHKQDERVVSSITNLTEQVLNDGGGQASTGGAPQPGGGLTGIGALIEREIPGTQSSSIGQSPAQNPNPQPQTNPAKAVQTTANSAPAASIPPAAITERSEQGRIYGAEHSNVRLVLIAKSDVWLRIQDSSGNVIFTQTLSKGDRVRVPNRKGLTVIARDGGLIAYQVDGVGKGALGAPGEILVGRSLNIATLAAKQS